MTFDEAFGFHEKLIPVVRSLLGGGDLGILNFAWVVPGIALVCLLTVFYTRFLAALAPRSRASFLAAGTVYLGGAIGVELIGGWALERFGYRAVFYQASIVVEESLEMAGAILFIWALMVHMANSYGEVTFRLAGAQAPADRK